MAFVAEAALIALREGLEALLITGILLGLVTRLGRPDARRHVWAGFAAAVAASVLMGVLVQRFFLDAFEAGGGAAWFELVAALAAVVVLTYMVFWMWSHTRTLMAALRERVSVALTAGTLGAVAFLTFASVLREGVEVVLFYAALASRATPVDLAWSGAVGFAASALIVGAILAGAWRVDLQRFFAVTGILLVFVAGGLIVHSVMAATDLGWLAPAPSVWDTSGVLADDSAGGRVLHALVGYTATPTLLQAVLYFLYVFGVGGAYLWGLGAFHSRGTGKRRVAPARVATALAAVLLAGALVAAGAANPGPVVGAHSHGPALEPASAAVVVPDGERVGVLLRSHGEPVHYNATTYRSFADFVANLLTSLGYGELLLVDQGTVLMDADRPFERGFHADARLVDAWLEPFAGPAAYVGTPFPGFEESRVPLLDGYYVAPGGPGLGEPDILEMSGLGAFVTWLQMENESPMHHGKLVTLQEAERILRERYGDRIVVATSYHIQPRVGPGESDADAARALADAGVTRIVDAYTSAVHSDVMNTCMMRPHAMHALAEAGLGDVPVAHAEPPGLTHAYAHAVATHLDRVLGGYPADARVAVFLTHHGATPGSKSPCGDAEDRYHANARAMFEAALAAIGEDVDRDLVGVFQVYGQGGSHPSRGLYSPLDAVDAARDAGATVIVDLPYELSADGMDNLVAHRASYGLEAEDAPHYDADGETHLTVRGLNVRILSSAFEREARALALVDVVERALAEALGGTPVEEDAHGHAAVVG